MVLAVAQALAGGQQHGDRRDRRHHRRDAGARQGSRDAADLGDGARHVVGTLPIGVLARTFGRRFALQIGFGGSARLAGLVCCAAVLQGSFVLFLVGAFGCGFYAAAHQVLSFCRRRHRERALPAEGDLLGAGRRRRCRGFIGPSDRHRHQGPLAAAICLPRPSSRKRRSAALAGAGADLDSKFPPPVVARDSASAAARLVRSRAIRCSLWRSPAASSATR